MNKYREELNALTKLVMKQTEIIISLSDTLEMQKQINDIVYQILAELVMEKVMPDLEKRMKRMFKSN